MDASRSTSSHVAHEPKDMMHQCLLCKATYKVPMPKDGVCCGSEVVAYNPAAEQEMPTTEMLERLSMVAEQFEALKDRLEDRHLGNELLALMSKGMQTMAQQRNNLGEVPTPLRIGTNVFLWRMTMSTRAPSMIFAEASQLFDLVCLCVDASQLPPHNIMAKAAAAWIMCYKFSEVQTDAFSFMYNDPLRLLSTSATRASVCLGGLEVTREAILAEERNILVNHAESLGFCNVLSSLQFFFGRLGVITEGQEDSLKEAWAWAEKMATTCVCYGSSPLQDSPMTWATGILAMSLAAVGLLSRDDILPRQAENPGMFATTTFGYQHPSPIPDRAAMISAALQLATAQPAASIRRSAVRILEVERQWQPFVAQLHQRAAAQ